MPLSSVAPLGPIWLENPLVTFLRLNIAVVIPVFILFLKIVVLRISGDVDELIHSIVITPMEVLLIALGFIFAGLSRAVPFEMQFKTETERDLAGTILIFLLAGLLGIMYRANRKAILYFEKYMVALERARLERKEGNVLCIRNSAKTAEGWNTAWAVGYFMAAILIWITNLAISIMVLWQILLRLQ